MIRRISSRNVSLFFLVLILNVLVLPEWVQPHENVFSDDPINSITEFVMEVCLDFEDITPGDEREEEAPFSNQGKQVSQFLVNDLVALKRPVSSFMAEICIERCAVFFPVYFDINTPPPEMA